MSPHCYLLFVRLFQMFAHVVRLQTSAFVYSGQKKIDIQGLLITIFTFFFDTVCGDCVTASIIRGPFAGSYMCYGTNSSLPSE